MSLDTALENQSDTMTDPQTQERVLSETQTILERGLQAKKATVESGAPVDFTTVSGGVTLAHVHLARRNPSAALDTLNDPVIGPMTLLRLQLNGEGTHDENLERFSSVFASPQWNNVYKTQVFAVALRVALEAKPEVLPVLLPELSKLLDDFSVPNSNDDAVKMSGTLVFFGQLLDTRLHSPPADADTSETEQIEPVLEKILERLQKHRENLDDKSLLWYADTLCRIGMPSPEKTLQYFSWAEQIYAQILHRHDATSPSKHDALRFRLALVRRSLGRFEEAYNLLVELLTEAEDRRNVQIETARTLQMWGVAANETQPGDVSGNENLVKAIVGDRKKEDGEYLVWGFNGVIKRVSPHFAKYTNEYYEAYHGKITCRVFLSRNLPQPDAETMIQGAKNDLARLRQLHPDLGGPDWQKRFEDLLKEP